MHFKNDWASLIVGNKLTVFALLYFVFEGNFPSTSLKGVIFGGVIKQRIFCVTGLGGLYLEGLIHGGAYFSEFYGIFRVIFTIGYITNSQFTCSPVRSIRSTDRGLPVVLTQSRFDTSCFKASLLSRVVNTLYT